MLEHRRLRVSERGDVLILKFVDSQLSADLSNEIGVECKAAADREGFRKILLDFSDVKYVCSDVIAKLVILNKTVREKGGRLKLCGICPYIREILVITKLDTIMDIAANEADALAAFDET
ncbi:MAG: STAS domain-containing protein [Rhodopirellula sp.]|nr:STAS domain-containing protein [Rhodopirellula sp.]